MGGLSSNHRPEDKENFTALLQEFRDQLDAKGSYLLTIAGAGGAEKMASMELLKVSEIVDWVNVMSYDFHGGWDSTTGHNAPFYPSSSSPFSNEASSNVDAALQGWITAGVEPDKVVMGAPIYGRGWGGVASTDNGLVWRGRKQRDFENGVYDFDDLAQNYVGQGDWVRSIDPESKALALLGEPADLHQLRRCRIHSAQAGLHCGPRPGRNHVLGASPATTTSTAHQMAGTLRSCVDATHSLHSWAWSVAFHRLRNEALLAVFLPVRIQGVLHMRSFVLVPMMLVACGENPADHTPAAEVVPANAAPAPAPEAGPAPSNDAPRTRGRAVPPRWTHPFCGQQCPQLSYLPL